MVYCTHVALARSLRNILLMFLLRLSSHLKLTRKESVIQFWDRNLLRPLSWIWIWGLIREFWLMKLVFLAIFLIDDATMMLMNWISFQWFECITCKIAIMIMSILMSWESNFNIWLLWFVDVFRCNWLSISSWTTLSIICSITIWAHNLLSSRKLEEIGAILDCSVRGCHDLR